MPIDRNFLSYIDIVTTPLISILLKRLFLEKTLEVSGRVENQLISAISKPFTPFNPFTPFTD